MTSINSLDRCWINYYRFDGGAQIPRGEIDGYLTSLEIENALRNLAAVRILKKHTRTVPGPDGKVTRVLVDGPPISPRRAQAVEAMLNRMHVDALGAEKAGVKLGLAYMAPQFYALGLNPQQFKSFMFVDVLGNQDGMITQKELDWVRGKYAPGQGSGGPAAHALQLPCVTSGQ